MKYFSPSYWFKLWVLSAPLFKDKTQGINAMSIDNKDIKDWANKNISDISTIENKELNFTNNNQTDFINFQTHLDDQKWDNKINNATQNNNEIDHFYENFLKTQGWSKDPQIAGQQLQEIQEEHHQFLKKQHEKSKKRVKKEIIDNSPIIIWSPNWHITSLAIDSYNNVYFGTNAGGYKLLANSNTPEKINMHKYTTNEYDGKNPSYIKSILIDKNDNVYFGTNNNCLWKLNSGESLPTRIWSPNWHITSLAIDSYNNVYFGTNAGGYKLLANSNTPKKINMHKYTTNEYDGKNPSYIKSILIDKNDNVYFGTNNNCLWKLNSGESLPTRIWSPNWHITSLAIDSYNNVYFGTNAGGYKLLANSNTPKKINMHKYTTNEYDGKNPSYIKSILIDKNDNVYFGTNNNCLWKLNSGESLPTRIWSPNWHITSLAIDSYNNVYFGTNAGGYKLLANSNTPEKINMHEYTTNEYDGKNPSYIKSILIDKNDNVYFGTNNNCLWKLTQQLDLSLIIQEIKLENILNDSDLAILNTLNYLNTNLDVNHLKIEKKDNISAIIKAKNNSKYKGSKKIYFSIDNNEIKIINFDELIKRAIFLIFRTKTYNSFERLINISYNSSLIYQNIELIKNSEIKTEKFLENICSGSIEFPILSYEETYQSPSCEYSQETTKKYEIKKGLSNTNGTQSTKEESTIKTTDNSQTDMKNWNSNIETGFSAFGFSLGGSTSWSGETSNTNENSTSNTNSSSTTVTLENTFDFSNTNTHEIKVSKKLTFPSQPVKVLANEQVKVSIVVNKSTSEIFLSLKQNIYGKINVVISSINISNKKFNISIKKLMQTLQENNLLPSEITINNDDSITFNGKILLAETKNNLDAKLNRDIINTPQIVKRDIEKWNITFAKTINQDKYLPIADHTNNNGKNITTHI